ncbi:CRE-SRG-39 protein [Caenorhabditis remanei]|uniref:Serpentine receptor class gamma n=1 Tax=Caenorhabditis remanei TaxID=31234 RepID=E3NGR6_CAERE|nr:CRE-SRG-39 protein [Caenorhabditis remanei]
MWLFVLALIYSIPSLILYFATVFVIIKYWKSLKSSFFVWYLLDFSMNLLTTCVTFITLKLSSVTCQTCFLSPIYTWLSSNLISNFLYCMMYHLSYVQYAITTIISINRMTIIWNHYLFEPLWRNYSFVLIFVIYFLPFISTGQLFESDCTFGKRLDDTFVLSCSLVRGSPCLSRGQVFFQPTSILFTPLIIFQIGCMVCSIICNATSLILVVRATKEIKAKMEINFLILIIVTTVVLFLGAAISFILSSYPTHLMYSFFHTYGLPLISDLFTIMHPWLMYVLSNPVRLT